MTDVIADHVSKVGPEVMSPQLAFVGLLHVIVENSKKNLVIEEYQDQIYIARDFKTEAIANSDNEDYFYNYS